jgi:hypothetical protein
MARREAARTAERGTRKKKPRAGAERSSHEGDPRPDEETRRRHGLIGRRSGSPPDRKAIMCSNFVLSRVARRRWRRTDGYPAPC